MWWRRSAICSTRPRPQKRNNVQGSRLKVQGNTPAWNLEPRTLNERQELFSLGAPFGRFFRVYGYSMTPTLHAGELVIVSERAYQTRPPQRGEIVAARPAAFGGRAFVKRIVGLPHERITFDGQEWCLGEGQFFLLGDHPDDSLDSRRFGPVTRTELIGPIRFRLWPWTRFYK